MDRIFLPDTTMAQGFRELLLQFQQRTGIDSPVRMYLAGGMAMHLYTRYRGTGDVDMEIMAAGRLHIPQDLIVELDDDTLPAYQRTLHFDTNYNSTFALMHEYYEDDAIPIQLDIPHLHVFALSPTDLAVSKIARWSDRDKEDVAVLVRMEFTCSKRIEQRAREALGGYVGNTTMLQYNIRDAILLAQGVEAEKVRSVSQMGCDTPSVPPSVPDRDGHA